MNTIQATLQIDVPKETARALLEQAGFTVTRIATPRATAPAVTPRNPFTRVSPLTDMPDGLSPDERTVYIRGYARGCMAYARKHGTPGVSGRGATRAILRQRAIEHEWDRHPSCHRAAMKALHDWREKYADYIAERKRAS